VTRYWPGASAYKLTKYAYATTLLRNTPVALPASHRGVRTIPVVHAAPSAAPAVAHVHDLRWPDRCRESSGSGRRHTLRRWGLAPRASDPAARSGGPLGPGALVRSALAWAQKFASLVLADGLVATATPGFRAGQQGGSSSGRVRGRLPRGAVMASLAGWRLPAVTAVPPGKVGEACPLIAKRSPTAMEGAGMETGQSITC